MNKFGQDYCPQPTHQMKYSGVHLQIISIEIYVFQTRTFYKFSKWLYNVAVVSVISRYISGITGKLKVTVEDVTGHAYEIPVIV
jgi:hypothetical protein